MNDRSPDERTLPDSAYRRMAVVLRVGLWTALVLMGAAIGAYLAAHPNQQLSGAINNNPAQPFLSAGALVGGLGAGDPAAFLTLGLLVLVATPILRVATGFYYFQTGRERAMAAISATVFGLLLLSLLVIGPLVR